jgi:hypothetical protein
MTVTATVRTPTNVPATMISPSIGAQATAALTRAGETAPPEEEGLARLSATITPREAIAPNQ